MLMNGMKAMPVILIVSVMTGMFFLLLPGVMLEKGASRVSQSFWWTVGSAITGLIIVAIYQWVAGRWPGMEADIFLKLGIITFIGFSLLAVAACPFLKMTGRIPVYILMHIVWAAGYGYYLPKLLKLS